MLSALSASAQQQQRDVMLGVVKDQLSAGAQQALNTAGINSQEGPRHPWAARSWRVFFCRSAWFGGVPEACGRVQIFRSEVPEAARNLKP